MICENYMKFKYWNPAAAAAAAAKSLQSCPTLCDPIDSSPPGSPVPGILQARTLEWVAFPSPMHESEKWKWNRSVLEFLLFRFKVGAAIPRSDTRGHDWTWYRRGCADTLENWVLFFPVVLYGIAGNSGFHGGSDGKESAYNAGNLGSIPGSGRYSREGNGNPLQYSYLRIPWREDPGGATVHGVTKNQTWLSD